MSHTSQRESFLGKLKQTGELTITVTGRKTKRKFSTPVWFAMEGQRILLVPVKGSDSNWFKNLEKNPEIELSVDDAKISSKANLVSDPANVKKILEKFRAKYKSQWSEYYSKQDVYVEVPV